MVVGKTKPWVLGCAVRVGLVVALLVAAAAILLPRLLTTVHTARDPVGYDRWMWACLGSIGTAEVEHFRAKKSYASLDQLLAGDSSLRATLGQDRAVRLGRYGGTSADTVCQIRRYGATGTVGVVFEPISGARLVYVGDGAHYTVVAIPPDPEWQTWSIHEPHEYGETEGWTNAGR